MTSLEQASARLAADGHRLTGPRRAVVRAMAEQGAPFTVDEITAAVPGVGRATVFRTVRLLQDADLVCRLVLEDGGIRYALSDSEHHHHLICSQCGAVSEFGDAGLDALIAANAREAGFALAGHSLELYGVCRRCAAVAANG